MKTRLPEIPTLTKRAKVSTNPSDSIDSPVAFDWRDHSAVGPVIDQGQLGVPSLYAAVGTVEGRRVVGYNEPFVQLSTQEMIDCVVFEPNDSPIDIFNDISYLGGIETADNYPSTGRGKGTCTFNLSSGNLTRVSGYIRVADGDESELATNLYELGPIAALIDGSDPAFQHYTGGEFTGDRCRTDKPNHALLIVCYGTDSVSKTNFWILKNSWGTTWGEGGYVRFERGINLCGVANYGSAPILA